MTDKTQEPLGAWERLDLETMIQNEHKLYADANERWQKAEAESATLRCQLEEAKAESERRRHLLARVQGSRVLDEAQDDAISFELDDWPANELDGLRSALLAQDKRLAEARALLAPLLELEARATKGPWMVNRYDNDGGYINWQMQQDGGEGDVIANVHEENTMRAKHDAHLMVAARNVLPALRAALAKEPSE